jgi:hypothetical protein
MKDGRIYLQMLDDILLGQDRPTSGDAAHQRQRQLLSHRVAEADTARRPGQQLDDALSRQDPQVLLRGVRRAKSKLSGDLGTRGGHSGFAETALDEAQYAGLAWS